MCLSNVVFPLLRDENTQETRQICADFVMILETTCSLVVTVHMGTQYESVCSCLFTDFSMFFFPSFEKKRISTEKTKTKWNSPIWSNQTISSPSHDQEVGVDEELFTVSRDAEPLQLRCTKIKDLTDRDLKNILTERRW